MGFYLRKGINFGPLRLNLSRSGVGASFGVKGARIGIGPRGRYVHVGRKGLYYRKSLGRGNALLAPGPGLALPATAVPEVPDPPAPGLDVSALVDSSSADLLAELERSHRASAWFPLALSVVAAAALTVGLRYPDWRALAGLPMAVALLLWVYRSDVKRCSTELHYHLDPPIEQAYASLVDAFAGLAACGGRWRAAGQAAVLDARSLAGASASIEPVAITPMRELPPRVHCNLEPPALHARARTLYLFPDRIVIFQGRDVGAIGWGEVRVGSTTARLIEQRPVPPDAKIVDHTWLHPNKDGSPDRRFNDNPQLPIVEYGDLRFTNARDLDERFLFSRPDAVGAFASAVAALVKTHPETDPPTIN
jgi:hypothetical protein